jgi:hypothetical protein
MAHGRHDIAVILAGTLFVGQSRELLEVSPSNIPDRLAGMWFPGASSAAPRHATCSPCTLVLGLDVAEPARGGET